MALTTGLATSIRILRADAAGLSRYLEEQATENPQLILAKPLVQEWLPRWKSAFTSDAERPEQEAAGPSLGSHVLGVIEAQRLAPADLRIAMALAEALEPSGWIGRSLPSIATQLGVAVPAVEAVLHQLQDHAEPTGLFARNLADCLRLQAQEAGELDPPMRVLLDRLDLLAKGEIDRIAREAGLELADLRQAFARLRSYDPKPGSGFEANAAPVREPDLIAEKGASGWIVSLNRSALPSVSVAEGRAKGRAKGHPVKPDAGQRTRMANRLPLQRAASDGARLPIRPDQHRGPDLTRRRPFDRGDHHAGDGTVFSDGGAQRGNVKHWTAPA